MGLAGPKKRAKLSHDPNNTAWSRNTESFGHKILASQGWAPGDTLGAKGAAHADHYTAASNSHIRVMLKDNQLGLGAKLGGNNAETFGLSLFSGILGRLNGKTDVEVEKEQRAQKDVELALYQSRKLGYINFVSAGFLVGDRIDKAEIVSKDEMKKSGLATPAEKTVKVDIVATEEPQGTKRKRTVAEVKPAGSTSDSDSSASEEERQEKAAHKTKKSKKEKKAKSSDDNNDNDDDETTKSVKRSKSKKDKKKEKSSSASSSDDEDRAAKKARKAARRAEKDERRAEKDERRKKKEAKRAAKSASASVTATPATTAPGTPAEPSSGTLTPQATPFIGRHAVRQRYIAAKGRAHLDPQALKEIFMVKA